MSTKVGKHGFHIRDMGNMQEIYDNRIIETIIDSNYYNNFIKYKKYIEDRVVLDLGSHVGCMVRKFLDLNAKKIVCVEPNEKFLECLKKNFENISSEKIEILKGAVDICSGITTFYEFRNNSSGSTIEKKKVDMKFYSKYKFLNESYNETMVNTFSFYEMIEKYKPSVVKMDIECVEWKLLYNPPPLCVNMLIIEWHNSLYPKYDVRKLPNWINNWNILFDNQKIEIDKLKNTKLKYNISGRDMVIVNVL